MVPGLGSFLGTGLGVGLTGLIVGTATLKPSSSVGIGLYLGTGLGFGLGLGPATGGGLEFTTGPGTN